jgi:glucose-6-phosphate-specific signal transduction histidine kinase
VRKFPFLEFSPAWGLLGMRERVTLLGGELDCKSAPGHGTEVHAFFPVPAGPDARPERFRKVTQV